MRCESDGCPFDQDIAVLRHELNKLDRVYSTVFEGGNGKDAIISRLLVLETAANAGIFHSGTVWTRWLAVASIALAVGALVVNLLK